MKDPALRLAQEQTTQTLIREAGALIRAPLFQAFIVWALAEGMMESTGRWSGPMARAGATFLEAGAIVRIFDVEKVVGDMTKVSQAIAPIIEKAAGTAVLATVK